MTNTAELRRAVLDNLYQRIVGNPEVEPSVLNAAIAFLKNFDGNDQADAAKAEEIRKTLAGYREQMPFKVVRKA